jgi:hypothetical protein
VKCSYPTLFFFDHSRREAWIRTIHTKQWYKKKRGVDKHISHKTMEQKKERQGKEQHTQNIGKKRRDGDKNNSHKTMIQKEERHG